MAVPAKISLRSKKIFYDLGFLAGDKELAKAVEACVEAQRKAVQGKLKSIFSPDPRARHEVSEEALESILKSGRAVNGIRTEREISNVIVFNDKRYENAVFSDEILSTRETLDQRVNQRLRTLFEEGDRLNAGSSGFFLYPPQGYMGWHTNWQNPGWRLYINYAEEPGKSFFRYQDPDTGKIVTLVDKRLNFRLFRTLEKKPFWHAVYSDTYRYSLGYKIENLRNRFVDRLIAFARNILAG